MKVNTLSYIFLSFTAFIWLCSCGSENTPLPKPRMYPRVMYPEKTYVPFANISCPFTFQMPEYGVIKNDTFRFEGLPDNPCWFDLNLTSLNASIHCSYYAITRDKSLTALVNDAFNLAGKHNIKANYRRESLINNGSDLKGVLFEIDGPVASPLQFYITDEKKHFFRASLYFNATVNPDSTAPVLQFLRPDLDTLISTFTWR